VLVHDGDASVFGSLNPHCYSTTTATHVST
jgi:hypothetical protein